MDNIRTVIIDDEPLARNRVRMLLQKDSSVEIVGECGNGQDAVNFLVDIDVDLAFLDVQMPELNGFEALQALQEMDKVTLPHVIFVTAFDRYALKAFEVQALDYLLKPYDDERFEQALQRAKEYISRKDDEQPYQQQLKKLLQQESEKEACIKRFLIKKGSKIHVLPSEDIDWIEASGYYIKLHSGKEAHLLRDTMNNMEAKLDPDTFIRIHRSTIVNMHLIKEFETYFKGEYIVILKNGEKLIMSRSYQKKVFDLLKDK